MHHPRKPKTIVILPCESMLGSMYSSVPSCNQTRRCKNGSFRTRYKDWGTVGELHTHPPAEDPQGRIIKPPSANDLYQLLIAHMNGYHNLLVTVASEGIYVSRVLRGPWFDRFKSEITQYFATYVTTRRTSELIQDCMEPHTDALRSGFQLLCPQKTFGTQRCNRPEHTI